MGNLIKPRLNINCLYKILIGYLIILKKLNVTNKLNKNLKIELYEM